MLRPFGFLKVIIGCCFMAIVARVTAQFPVPRAEQEFRALMPYIRKHAEPLNGDVETFTKLVQPFAPLDLQVAKATAEEADTLRNFYFGICGAAAGLPQQVVPEMANRFHCGPVCIEGRKKRALGRLTEIDALLKLLQSVGPRVKILAQWGQPGDFRVNQVFAVAGIIIEYGQSAEMGITPSPQMKVLPSLAPVLSELKISDQQMKTLVEQMKRSNIVAVVQSSEGLRLVSEGLVDNEAGILVLTEGTKRPRLGQKMLDGREYKVLDSIKPGWFYYETT